MGFMDLCKNRYSVRKFDDRPVEEEKLSKILEAGRIAPTARNLQPQRIYVIKSPEARAKLSAVTKMTYEAPLSILVCYDRNESWKNAFGEDYNSGEMDASIVGTQMMYMATDLGLGTLWARGFNSKDIHDAFNLPENIVVAFFLDVGYPAKDYVRSERPRKDASETITVL